MQQNESGAETDAPTIPKRKKGRPCKPCYHKDRAEIDRELMLAQTTVKSLASRFGFSEPSLARHRDRHLPIATRQEAADGVAEAEGNRGSSLLEDASSLRRKTLDILATAEKTGNLTTALQAIREAGRLIELQGKLMGQIDTTTTVNIAFSPVLISLQSAILKALLPHPEARQAVLLALGQMDGTTINMPLLTAPERSYAEN